MAPSRSDRKSSESPIFVIGTGRSGTTLLRMMLNAHPRIYVTHEASFYMSALTAPRLDGRAWLEHFFHSAAFAWLRTDPEDVRSRVPETLPRADIPKAYNAVMAAKAAQYDRPRFGDKTPLHSSFLPQIFRDYPNPRVVHIVRDPRGTVASLMRMPWSAATVGLNNLYCHRQMKEVKPFLGRVHELRLEDLTADPERVMRGVLDFVGEPWDDAVLDHVRHAPLDDMPPFPWFRAATGPPRPRTGTPKWMSQLGPAWVRRIETINRKGMRRYGYGPAVVEREPSAGEKIGVELKGMGASFRCLAKLRGLQKLLSRVPSPHPDEAVRAMLDLNPDAWKLYPDFEWPEIPKVPGIEWPSREPG